MNQSTIENLSQQASQSQLLEQVLVMGNLSQLSSEQKVNHLIKVCESVGLNHLTKPFEYITLNGKLTLYAKRDATDQLRKIHKVSVHITSREHVEGVYVVTARATMPDGRTDESIGAVALNNSKGDVLANLYMKAETKAKRRVTLSICGLGILDETEVETVQHVAAPEPVQSIDPGCYVVPIGKKYQGRMLKDIPTMDIEGFVGWLKDQAAQKNEPLTGLARQFVEKAEEYLLGVDL